MRIVRITLFVALCAICVPTFASTLPGDTIRAPRPKVGIVLGGGGAKGAAHIGVLKYIEEVGIPIDYVAGTSMGSIIGGLYAMGYSPDELSLLIADINWSEYVGNSIDRLYMSPELRKRSSTMFMNIPFSMEGIKNRKSSSRPITGNLPSAYVNNTALINLFNDLCIGYQEDTDFNELPIPFACVATDIATGNEVVIRHGSVPTAMRASMAIPGVFTPVLMDHKVLVDGGLVNNFPADVVRDMGADIIIGVEVSDKLENELDEIPSLPQVLSYLITNAVGSKREENRHLCTLYLDPDISGYGTLSFTPEAIDTLVQRGYQKAKDCREQLLRIKQYVGQSSPDPLQKLLNAPKAKNLKDAPIFVSTITMNQSENLPSDWLARKGGLEVGTFISSQDIERAVNLYRGTGAFNDITYNIYENEMRLPDNTDTYSLVLNFKPTLPHVLGIGTRYDTEEGAAMLISLGLNEKRLSGFKLNLTGRLSYNPRFNVTGTYAMIPFANFNAAYDYRSQHFKTMLQDQNTNLHYEQHRFSVFASQYQTRELNTALGFSFAITRFDQAFDNNRLGGPFINLQYDNLDHAYFARHGINTRFRAQMHFDPAQAETFIQDYSFSFEGYYTPENGRLTYIPQLYNRLVFGNTQYANLWNVVGGDILGRHIDQQMPFIGVTHLSKANDMATILRCDLRYNFYGKHYVTAMTNFLLGTDAQHLRRGNLISDFSFGLGVRYSYSSPIGPLFFDLHYSNITRSLGGYFSLGYTF
ncbi:MAG: patatin-like phospholipase family protein [Bacteroidales bacterium]|nr:patatin-like phospholipase family protein [Bacteroidales bacterium]